jgi:hypothetical protein
MGESSTSADIVRGAEHRLQAVRPRRGGHTQVDIGVQVGISHQRAQQLVSDELRQLQGQISEATEDVRRIAWELLDAVTLALLTEVKRADAAAVGAC